LSASTTNEEARNSVPYENESALNTMNSSLFERGLIDQAVQAQGERAECLRIRTTLRAEVLRTAERYWDEAQEDEVARLRRMFNVSPSGAMVGLTRSAAGCRFLIAAWERLEKKLAEDGTWYGADRIDAILFQGFSAVVEDLYLSEQAYLTWVHCLAAQPNPKEPDIDLILEIGVMPKALQDRGEPVWPRDPSASRTALAELVARELPMLREREEYLRIHFEAPARAEAKEQALGRLATRKEEVALLRAQRSHEEAYERACRALMTLRGKLGPTVPPQARPGELLIAPPWKGPCPTGTAESSLHPSAAHGILD
jgi:hypothetical protein